MKLLVLTLLIINIGCKENIHSNVVEEKKDSTITNGVFYPYPYRELQDVLRISNADSDKVLMYKETSRNKLQYIIEYNKGNISESFTFPFYRSVIDYAPFLSQKLDKEIEKMYYQTPAKSFIVKLEYGTGHIRWNYLFEMGKVLRLKDIFYVEPISNRLGVKKGDSIMNLIKISINKEIKDISIKEIKSINENVASNRFFEKEEKWIIR